MVAAVNPNKLVQAKALSDSVVLGAVREARASWHTANPRFAYDFLPGFPTKVVLYKMSKMVDRKLLNYGVSLRTAWIEGEE